MRTVHWQLSFDGLLLSQESHAWGANIQFEQCENYFNIQQAGIRRPVRAQVDHKVFADRRFGRIVLANSGKPIPVVTVGVETDFPVRKFEFDADWLNSQLPDDIVFDFRTASAQPMFDEPCIGITLDRIYDELVTPRADSKRLLQPLIQILAMDTARCLIARSSQQEVSLHSLSPEQLMRIRHLIQTTDFGDLTLGYIAERMAMTQTRLRKMFKRATGSSLHDEIHEARLQAACRKLVETGDPLKIIAHQLGFRHVSAFCYWFKQSTGRTPSQHRNLQHCHAVELNEHTVRH